MEASEIEYNQMVEELHRVMQQMVSDKGIHKGWVLHAALTIVIMDMQVSQGSQVTAQYLKDCAQAVLEFEADQPTMLN